MATASIRSAVATALKEYKPSSSLSYGTAGFRCLASKLPGVAFRVGVLAALRSLIKDRFVGVMITASHNPACDNGIKFIDPDGGMLETSWEPVVMEFMRCSESDGANWIAEHLRQIDEKSTPRVLLGFDTRESSPQLASEVKLGVETMQGLCLCLDLVTTPELHYAVYYMNEQLEQGHHPEIPNLDEIYIRRFAERFHRGLKTLPSSSVKSALPVTLNIDCANGIGGVILNRFVHEFTKLDCPVRLNLHNTQTTVPDLLNKNCGADFVKLTSKAPNIHDADADLSLLGPGNRWASIDGDADRLIYFYRPEEEEGTTAAGDVPRIALLDGDRIASLFATLIIKMLPATHELTVGVVQTAYANAASTNYLEQKLSVPVVCVPTGVKHLHRAAHRFDFGIYFEANGHGTVLFSTAAHGHIHSLAPDHPLAVFASLTNTTIGDAITDTLMVEYALACLGWSISDWSAMYTDLASRQLKVSLLRPQNIQTIDAERRISHPPELQTAIDELVRSVQQATKSPGSSRAFVRPSGTENMARVYAESVTQPLADWLATKVAILTHKMAGGIGEPLTDPGPMPLS